MYLKRHHASIMKGFNSKKIIRNVLEKHQIKITEVVIGKILIQKKY